jgi:hypothetical protein
MAESSVWGSSRYFTLLLVLVIHVAVIALLVMGSRTSIGVASASPPIELMWLPPTKVPSVRIDGAPSPHLHANLSISLTAPELDPSSSSAPAPSAADHGGSGVNWAAEAHRAVQAFEIRRDQQVNHSTLGSSPWDGWLPRRERHAGDRFRTDSGDWIVWINADCYQVASWHAGAPAQDATQTPTICVGDDKKLTPRE